MPMLPVANGSAESTDTRGPEDDRELLLRAVEGAKLAAEEATKAAQRVDTLRAKLETDMSAATKQRRLIGLATVVAGVLPDLIRSLGG
jgi:hypothetical protein